MVSYVPLNWFPHHTHTHTLCVCVRVHPPPGNNPRRVGSVVHDAARRAVRLTSITMAVLTAGALTIQPIQPELHVAFGEDATFTVSVGGTLWLESAPVRVFANGAWQQLTRTGVERYKGVDALGSYSCVNVSWSWCSYRRRC